MTFYLWKWCNWTCVPNPHSDPDLYVFGPLGSVSGSVGQRYRSKDPDPYQNVTDPHHCLYGALSEADFVSLSICSSFILLFFASLCCCRWTSAACCAASRSCCATTTRMRWWWPLWTALPGSSSQTPPTLGGEPRYEHPLFVTSSFLIFFLFFYFLSHFWQIVLLTSRLLCRPFFESSSVADPDPQVFGPPGSGSICQSYGSGSYYHHAKIVGKILIPTIFKIVGIKILFCDSFWLFIFEKLCKCTFKK